MFANNRVIFVYDHFFSHRPRVLFGYVKVAGARGRVQAYLDCGWLGHDSAPQRGDDTPVKSLKPALYLSQALSQQQSATLW